MSEISKSPFNYIGNKYRIIKNLTALFPSEINTFVDLFCGGCDVTINVEAKKKYANDINTYLIDIYRFFQEKSAFVVPYIDETIKKWGLSKENEEAFKNFRMYYNTNRNPLDLYVLMCFSFNYQFRFNACHEYNNAFGKNRSCFNSVMKKNLEIFLDKIKNVNFFNVDFCKFNLSELTVTDFVYCDPPYLLSCGSYNDGKRGFKGWSWRDDEKLFDILDFLNQHGIRFALSNVSEHKGIKNYKLLRWVERNRYILHQIDFNYDNCNYHSKNKQSVTQEVLVTNYFERREVYYEQANFRLDSESGQLENLKGISKNSKNE